MLIGGEWPPGKGGVMPQQKLESVVDLAAKAKAVRRDVLLQVYKAQSLSLIHI